MCKSSHATPRLIIWGPFSTSPILEPSSITSTRLSWQSFLAYRVQRSVDFRVGRYRCREMVNVPSRARHRCLCLTRRAELSALLAPRHSFLVTQSTASTDNLRVALAGYASHIRSFNELYEVLRFGVLGFVHQPRCFPRSPLLNFWPSILYTFVLTIYRFHQTLPSRNLYNASGVLPHSDR